MSPDYAQHLHTRKGMDTAFLREGDCHLTQTSYQLQNLCRQRWARFRLPQTKEGDRFRWRVASYSVHCIVNTADKRVNITGDHQHDVAGDYLQSTRFRRALKKHISTHDCDVKEVYNRVAADYGPDIRTVVPFAQPWAIVGCGHVFCCCLFICI